MTRADRAEQVTRRPEPEVTDHSRAFWAGGRHGRLFITRCADCRTWLHPPLPVCPDCGSDRIVPEAVSGRGSVYSYTVNRHRWSAEIDPPYVLAQVELDEHPSLRLLTALVGAAEPAVGDRVRVDFEQTGDVWIPVFVHES